MAVAKVKFVPATRAGINPFVYARHSVLQLSDVCDPRHAISTEQVVVTRV
jgi:hypothetical protein